MPIHVAQHPLAVVSAGILPHMEGLLAADADPQVSCSQLCLFLVLQAPKTVRNSPTQSTAREKIGENAWYILY
jgi:hypothetical protein